jgi:hypothetical protein
MTEVINMSKLALVNKETGEILEDNVLFIGRKPYKVDKGFVKIFVAFLKDVVENPKIAGKSIRLLFYMIEKMDYNTYTITIIPKYAREELRISEKTFYRWLNDLIEEGLISKVDTYTYVLNPYIGVKGNVSEAMKNDVGV